MKAGSLGHVMALAGVGLFLVLCEPERLAGQTPDPSSANLDSLRTELDRMTQELSTRVREVMEENLSRAAATTTVRSEVVRVIDMRRTEIETLRAEIARAEAAQAGQLSGIVTNAETGRTITAAQILVEGTTVGALSDSNGRFTFASVPSGTHTIRVRRLGFVDVRQANVVIRRGATTDLDLAMPPTVAPPSNRVMIPVAEVGGLLREGERIVRLARDGEVAHLTLQGGQTERVVTVPMIFRESPNGGGWVLLPSDLTAPTGDSRQVPEGGLPLIVVDGVPFEPSAPYILGQRFVAGVELAPLNPVLARYFKVESGVLVLDVTDPSPGADAGLLPGDVLVSVRERPVRTVEDVRQAFSGLFATRPAANGIPLSVIRDGTTMELRIPPR